MQEGLANVCLMTSHMTVVRSKIEKAIPRKRPGYSGHGKALEHFFETTLQVGWTIEPLAVLSQTSVP